MKAKTAKFRAHGAICKRRMAAMQQEKEAMDRRVVALVDMMVALKGKLRRMRERLEEVNVQCMFLDADKQKLENAAAQRA